MVELNKIQVPGPLPSLNEAETGSSSVPASPSARAWLCACSMAGPESPCAEGASEVLSAGPSEGNRQGGVSAQTDTSLVTRDEFGGGGKYQEAWCSP